MNLPRPRPRSIGALAAATAVLAFASAPAADAAPLRTATTTKYSTATYLQHALGLPTSDTDPALEPVTYDRFQWLLQQSGNIAVLIGDPDKDGLFKARARDAEAAAKAAGVKKVYWFNPNLSGSVKVGDVTEPNLDIRNPAGITSLAAVSRQKYDNAWRALVGQYLGNGLRITQNGLNTENATVTVAIDPTVVNDNGTTEADQAAGALYDYTGGTAPTNVQDSFFLVYNKDRKDNGNPAKIASWTNLTKQDNSTAAREDVTKGIDKVGASNLAAPEEFGFWKSEVNAKQVTQAGSPAQGAGTPVLKDTDAADAWRVNQITYPELVDLLESGANDANAVILFGGTWCPNTRAVLPSINKYAQQNDVTVYNFDTVLDGGLVGGATTSASDPLQTRNTHNNGSTTPTAANPSFLYGDLVAKYLNNLKTEYDPASNSVVTHFVGGDTSGTPIRTRKLQVPYLVGYQKGGSGDGVKRQWIINNGDGTYKEYMSNWWLTNPQADQLGLTQIPAAAPIWSTINDQVRNVSWQTDPATLYPNTAVDTDDDKYLIDTDTAKVTYTPAGANPASVSISSNGTIAISPTSLSAALSALGGSAPTNLAGAKTALIAAETATSRDETLLTNLRTVTGAWGVAQSRKTTLLTRWGNPTSPSSIIGGLTAVHQVDLFFGGLPGGVLSRRTLTADPVVAGTAPKITVAIANDHGRVPTGPVSLVVKKDGATVATASTPVSGDAASFTLPTLGAGTYDYVLTYAADDQIAGFSESGRLTVTAAPDEPKPPVVTPDDPTPGVTTPNTPIAGPGPVPGPLPGSGSGSGPTNTGLCEDRQGQGRGRQGADPAQGRQVPGHDQRPEGRLGGRRQGDGQAEEGRDHQDPDRAALARRGHGQRAEARQGHLEGHDQLAGRRPLRVGLRFGRRDQGHEVAAIAATT